MGGLHLICGRSGTTDACSPCTGLYQVILVRHEDQLKMREIIKMREVLNSDLLKRGASPATRSLLPAS